MELKENCIQVILALRENQIISWLIEIYFILIKANYYGHAYILKNGCRKEYKKNQRIIVFFKSWDRKEEENSNRHQWGKDQKRCCYLLFR